MDKEKDLNLPIIKEDLPSAPVLSMDEYVKFVQFNYKYIVDRKAALEQDERTRVDVRFRL